MPLVAAAVCPHPPLIVPEIAAGAAAEMDDLRAACDAAVGRLAASGARRLVILGADDATREYSFPFRGSFAAWGAPVEVSIGGGLDRETEPLPLSLLVGAWLTRRGFSGDEQVGYAMYGIARDSDPEFCAGVMARQQTATPWALLVMGDGSACRGPKAPGYDDPRAEPYDKVVSQALADADVEGLLGLDRELSTQLKVAGRAPWQVLAGAARASGTAWRGEVGYDAAPYGVAYFVATWLPA